MTYPSGRPLPKYGPRTATEHILDALEWAFGYHNSLDIAKTAERSGTVIRSELTAKLQVALSIISELADNQIKEKEDERDTAEHTGVKGFRDVNCRHCKLNPEYGAGSRSEQGSSTAGTDTSDPERVFNGPWI